MLSCCSNYFYNGENSVIHKTSPPKQNTNLPPLTPLFLLLLLYHNTYYARGPLYTLLLVLLLLLILLLVLLLLPAGINNFLIKINKQMCTYPRNGSLVGGKWQLFLPVILLCFLFLFFLMREKGNMLWLAFEIFCCCCCAAASRMPYAPLLASLLGF